MSGRRAARAPILQHLVAIAFSGAVISGCGGGRESESPADWKACRQADPIAAYDGASLLADGEEVWIASVDSPAAAVPRLSLRHGASGADLLALPAVATLVGTSPSLVRLDAGELGLLYRSAGRNGCRLLFRRFEIRTAAWKRPSLVGVSGAAAPVAANGRLLRTDSGLLFPAVEFAQPGVPSTATVVLYASTDGGAHWTRRPVSLGRAALAPALAAAPDGSLVLVVNSLGLLHRTVSTDGGASWSPLEKLGIPAQESPHALYRAADGTDLLLAWTESQPHKREVAPSIRALRWSLSADAGRSWTPPRTFAARPGWVPRAPSLAAGAGSLHVALEPSQGEQRQTVLLTLPLAALRGEDDAVDRRRLRDNLRTLVAHTLQRSERAPFLFVECYFMRSLVAAHTALAPFVPEHEDWLDTSRGVALAKEYADQLVQTQQTSGTWSIGYKSRFVADMAVCIELFRDLAPHVDAERRQRYTTAATRFLQALEHDALLLPNGAVGVGRSGGMPFDRSPYVVATALAGAAARAWLFEQTGEEAWRRSSLASLRWLVAQIRPDGSVPGLAKEEALIAAAYMGEGVLPAMALLDASEAGAFDAALRRHVEWILRQQHPDGTWGEPGTGVPQRAPLLVNFLLWVEERNLAGAGVRQALVEAGRALDFDAWRAAAVFAPGEDAEIYRALAGVPLAALVQEKPVF